MPTHKEQFLDFNIVAITLMQVYCLFYPLIFYIFIIRQIIFVSFKFCKRNYCRRNNRSIFQLQFR